MDAMHRLTYLVVVGLLGFMVSGTASAQSSASDPTAVTFAKDIAPILQRSCQQCHRPASVAPMSLLTYQEVRPWARAIKMRTGLRSERGAMPPWFAWRNASISIGMSTM